MNAKTKPNESVMTRSWIWIKGFPKRHKIITTLVLLYAAFKLVMTPIVNPFASDVYTIRGRFPFDEGYELVFQQSVVGEADWFQRWCGWPFSEGRACSAGITTLKPVRIAANHYELKIYRDRYFFWPQNWSLQITHSQFKVNAGVDVERLPLEWYINDVSSVCDDSEEMMKKYRGKLFCTSQFRHKDFKHLHLPDGQPVKANERLINFWLERELTPLLNTHQTRAQP